jgi:NADH-quinone oxidoreductase subunit L
MYERFVGRRAEEALADTPVVLIVGLVTALFAATCALAQDDIKRVLAYSTVSQLGYMMAALGVGGYTAGIFHLFTHGFFKALLFLGSGSLIHAVHSNNMSDMGGLRKPMPVTFWTFIIGTLALAGFPLTAGFFSKDEILVSASVFAANGYAVGNLVFWIGLLAAFVTTFYMARACFLIFAGETRAHHEPHESGRLMTVPLVVLAVLSIASGYIGSPFWSPDTNFETWTATHTLEELDFPFMVDGEADHAAGVTGTGVLAAAPPTAAGEDILAVEGSPHVLHGPPTWHFDVLAYALLAFLAAVVLAFRFYGRGLPDRDPVLHMGPVTRALVNKYGFDTFGYRYVVVPVRDRLAAAATWSSNVVIDGMVAGAGRSVREAAVSTYEVLDQRVIDGGVNGAAFSAAWWSQRLKRIQSGDVQRYAAALVAGVVVLVVVFAAGR